MIAHGPHPPEPVRVATMQHRWECLTFLHWSYDPAVVQRLLPAGLEVETREGRAWVGLVPFLMRVGAARGPLPLTFPETNVRTYVVGPGGRPGVYFFSLDAGSLPAVTAARATLGLPYQWARMSVDRGDDRVRYQSLDRRLPRRPVGHDITVRPGEPLGTATEFDHYLTARFALWSRYAGRMVRVQVEHPSWSLRRATVDRIDENLVAAAGLPAPSGEPRVHFSDGVDVRIGVPRLSRRMHEGGRSG